MATINTTTGIHGWLPNEDRDYKFYGVTAMVRYVPSEYGAYWQGLSVVDGTELRAEFETYDADRVVSSAQQACADLVLAGLALNELKLTAVSK